MCIENKCETLVNDIISAVTIIYLIDIVPLFEV